MPILIHPESFDSYSPIKLKPGTTACKFSDPDNTPILESPANLSAIKDSIDRFKTFMESLDAPTRDKLVFFSNFRISDVQKLTEENPDCGFIRVYTALDQNNKPFTLMVPVLKGNDGLVKSADSTKYAVECCHCQPNCSGSF